MSIHSIKRIFNKRGGTEFLMANKLLRTSGYVALRSSCNTYSNREIEDKKRESKRITKPLLCFPECTRNRLSLRKITLTSSYGWVLMLEGLLAYKQKWRFRSRQRWWKHSSRFYNECWYILCLIEVISIKKQNNVK